MYGVDGGICPPLQINPWTKSKDPTEPLRVVCVKEEGIVGILGIHQKHLLGLWEPAVEPPDLLELMA